MTGSDYSLRSLLQIYSSCYHKTGVNLGNDKGGGGVSVVDRALRKKCIATSHVDSQIQYYTESGACVIAFCRLSVTTRNTNVPIRVPYAEKWTNIVSERDHMLATI